MNQENNHQTMPSMEGAQCPIPLGHRDQIMMGHGSGGRMSHDLIRTVFLPGFDNPILGAGDDAGVIELASAGRLAVSTDSHTVYPLFFPGGDIGRLSVCGTVNDVAVMGAVPLYLTAGFILEEGLDMDILRRVVESMHASAREAGVQIISGDTKVVQKGKADGIYINTTGVGIIPSGVTINGASAHPGDAVILSGPIGDHGVAILAARGELGFETEVRSDTAPLNHMIAVMLASGARVHVLRDPTRGGVGTTLNEIARQSRVCIRIQEDRIPIRPEVAAVCEMLGFDPLYLANEGRILAIVDGKDAEKTLAAMRAEPYGVDAVVIGEVLEAPQSRVLMKTIIGSTRIVDMLAGEILPRIC